MGFEDDPPYDLLIQKMQKEIKKIDDQLSDQQKVNHCFEWNVSAAQNLKSTILKEQYRFGEENELSIIMKKAQKIQL